MIKTSKNANWNRGKATQPGHSCPSREGGIVRQDLGQASSVSPHTREFGPRQQAELVHRDDHNQPLAEPATHQDSLQSSSTMRVHSGLFIGGVKGLSSTLPSSWSLVVRLRCYASVCACCSGLRRCCLWHKVLPYFMSVGMIGLTLKRPVATRTNCSHTHAAISACWLPICVAARCPAWPHRSPGSGRELSLRGKHRPAFAALPRRWPIAVARHLPLWFDVQVRACCRQPRSNELDAGCRHPLEIPSCKIYCR